MANNATQWLMEKLPNISYIYLSPTANMGSRSSLMSCWMQGPIARASMLMQVKTVASTCMDFCLLKTDTIRAIYLRVQSCISLQPSHLSKSHGNSYQFNKLSHPKWHDQQVSIQDPL